MRHHRVRRLFRSYFVSRDQGPLSDVTARDGQAHCARYAVDRHFYEGHGLLLFAALSSAVLRSPDREGSWSPTHRGVSGAEFRQFYVARSRSATIQFEEVTLMPAHSKAADQFHVADCREPQVPRALPLSPTPYQVPTQEASPWSNPFPTQPTEASHKGPRSH